MKGKLYFVASNANKTGVVICPLNDSKSADAMDDLISKFAYATKHNFKAIERDSGSCESR